MPTIRLSPIPTRIRALKGYALLALAFSLPGTATAADEVYYVPDVEGQFAALPERGDALGFGIGGSPDPSMCKHYQGIVRKTGPGTPYFFITRSGNETASCSLAGDDPGNLLVVKMGSRATHGERLRSNRIARDTDTDDTPPDPADTTVAVVTFDGTGGWPHYGHPGGMQIVGDVLVLPLEKPYASGPPGLILFIDVSNPEVPALLSQFPVVAAFTPGVVAVTRLPNGRYMMLATGGDNEVLLIFESDATEQGCSSDLTSPNLCWTLLDAWWEQTDEADLGGGHDWPTNPFGGPIVPINHPHQSLNFVRQGGPAGPLYLVGIRNPGGGGGGPGLDEDKFDLYRVEWEGPEFKLRWVQTKEITAKSTSDGEDLANFAAASGVYVSPTGELIIYTTEHDNDGPEIDGVGTIKAGEWRHGHVVRPGSPTLDPTAVAGGPYTVPEGGSVTLYGQGQPPITKAWIEMFADPDFDDRSVVIDYDDWNKDDFDDFRDIEGGIDGSGFSDKASSWRWYAPQGCTLRANDDDFGDSSFPGNHTRTLYGDGAVSASSNLEAEPNDSVDDDMDNEVTSMQFFPDCTDYYNASMALAWDLDGDMVFETPGDTALFSAAGLDGPSLLGASLKVSHPIDLRAGTDLAAVVVTNVPPLVGALVARDSLGQVIGVDVPAAVIGLEIEVSGSFTDPGIPDTQTAAFDWDDGHVDLSSAFDSFSDAFGGATGLAVHSHLYTQPGTYGIVLGVTDDDGGQGQGQTQVEILDFADAVMLVLDDLKNLLAQPGLDPRAADLIGQAIEKLEGNNGALDQLDAEDFGTALVRIMYALLKLEEAEDLVMFGYAPHLLMQIAKAIVAVGIVEAQAAASSAADLAKIAAAQARVAESDLLIGLGEYFVAARTLHDAFVLLP